MAGVFGICSKRTCFFRSHPRVDLSSDFRGMDQCICNRFFLILGYLSCCGLYAVCNYVFFCFFFNRTYISKHTFCQAAIEMASMLLS